MKPSIGRVIITKGIDANGSRVHPAIVNRVWSDAEPSEATFLVNVTVFPDCGAPQPRGSIRMFDSEELADAHLATLSYSEVVGYWTARA
jgi:hypothetical protein